MSTIIKASVGNKAKNNPDDVRIIQYLLNRSSIQATSLKPLKEDGVCGSSTISAIETFQKMNLLAVTDGRVDPKGTTIIKLLQQAKAKSPEIKPASNILNIVSAASPILLLTRYLFQYSTAKFESDHKSDGDSDNLRQSEEFKLLIATIYGEAATSSEIAWQSIACVVLNRIGVREWSRHKTATDIIKNTGFDAYTHRNKPYITAEDYMKENQNSPGNNKIIEKMISCLTPIYLKKKSDITNRAVLYYSPKAQAALHKINPKVWKSTPNWNFNLLDEVNIPSLLSSDDFKFYKYK